MKLVGTGHRQSSLPGSWGNKKLHKRIKEKIKEIVQDTDPDIIISGMALGFDQWLAEVAVELKIPFIAALPFEGQENKWPPKSQEHYRWLLSKATKTVQVDRQIGYQHQSIPPDVYHPSKMMRRNEWMIHQLQDGDVLLSLYNYTGKGGTKQCVQYAHTYRENIARFINISTNNNQEIKVEGFPDWRTTDDYQDVPF